MVKTLIWKISDNDGDQSTTSIYLPDAATDAQVIGFAQQQAPLLDDIIGGRIDGCDFTVDVDISGLTGNVLSGNSDVEEIAAFNFATVQGEPVKVNIPAMSEAYVTAGSDAIDTAHPSVSPFVAAMTSGLTVVGSVNVAPCAKNEDDIASVTYARENARSSGSRR